MAAVARVLEDLDARQVLVEALAVPARGALLQAALSASPMVLSLDSDKQPARRLPPRRRADRNDQQPASRGAAVPRKTKADAAKRCCASSFVSPLDSVVGSFYVRGGQRPNRFASRPGASRGRRGGSGARVESGRESSARLGFVFALWGCPFCASRPAPTVFARSYYREALVAPRLLRARDRVVKRIVVVGEIVTGFAAQIGLSA